VLELNARVRAQLRRRRRTDEALREGGARTDASELVRFGDDVVVDLAKRIVTRHGADVKLSAMELKLLEHLLGREGAVLPRNELLDQVWGYERFPSTRTVDTHVWKLRQKLERDPEQPEHFLTVHGIGYRFVLTPN
jgi:DNA-binding response OmpR family regulator